LSKKKNFFFSLMNQTKIDDLPNGFLAIIDLDGALGSDGPTLLQAITRNSYSLFGYFRLT